jgi:alkanesulfonate monooxygenase SsuD/methylene tetrahydromethanopterin reductase-like flavin-dependent oxidoreductase (luciferase family)
MSHPRLSIALPVHGTPFAHTLAVARAVERAGFDAAWVPDHLVNQSRPRAGVLECWTVLAALAGVTQRLRLGPLIVATPLRHPPLLAKQVATLDNVAPGRITLGVGAGGFTYHAACAQLGITPLAASERVVHVEETIRCVRALLTDDPASIATRFVRVTEARVFPRPAQPIPIVVAAHRPRMLELAARLADGWNCPLPEHLEAGLTALARAGRERSTIEVSAYVVAVVAENAEAAARALARAGRAAHAFGDVTAHHIVGGPQRVIDRIADFVRRGADHLVLDLRGTPHLEAIELLAREVLPHLERSPSS